VGRSAVAARVGGLLAIGFDGTTIEQAPAYVIGGLAGAVLFKRNIRSAAQTRLLVDGLQASVPKHSPPLLIAIDEEGGTVSRIGGIGTWMPSAMSLGAADDPALTESIYAAIGEELAALGVTMDFAPVADVNTNPRNPVIGVRAFGDRPERVGKHVAAAIRGLHASGVKSAAKHFPGHGDALVDSHLDMPVIEHTAKRLRAMELVPFAAAIDAGVDAVMVAHIWFAAFESARMPATMSRGLMRGLLREELGFDGVICTDCMQMRAVSASHGPGDAAVQAVAAGADLVLFSSSLDAALEARKALEGAVLDGTLEETDVARSLERVERLRQRPLARASMQPADFGSAERRVRAVHAAQQGITLVRDRRTVLPLSVGADDRVLVVTFGGMSLTPVENGATNVTSLGALLRAHFTQVDEVSASLDPSDDIMRDIASCSRRAAAIVCVTYRVATNPNQLRAVTDLAGCGAPLVIVMAREPFDADVIPSDAAVLAAFGDDPPALAAACAVIVGVAKARGALPVTLASVAP
jgi:beta-N-acetylhexosaminidase